MTREQLKKHWQIIEAYKNGAIIEFSFDNVDWNEIEIPKFDIHTLYRVKPEPKHVPFDFSDAENLIGKAVKNKDGSLFLITTFTIVGFEIGNTAISFNNLFENFTFLDGSLCGKLSNK